MIVQCPAPPIQNEKLLILAKISWKPELNFSLNSETVPYFTWKLELFPNTLWMMVGRAKVSAGFTWKYYVFILETRFWIWCSGVLHIPLPTYSFVHLKFWENLSWRGIFSQSHHQIVLVSLTWIILFLCKSWYYQLIMTLASQILKVTSK